MVQVKNNAWRLYFSAELLVKDGRYRYACFLLVTAIEEFAKSIVEGRFPRSHGQKASKIKAQSMEKIKTKICNLKNELITSCWSFEQYSLCFDEDFARLWTLLDEQRCEKAIFQKQSYLTNLTNEGLIALRKRERFLYADVDAITENEAVKFYPKLKRLWWVLAKP